jgi:hypothetical protein
MNGTSLSIQAALARAFKIFVDNIILFIVLFFIYAIGQTLFLSSSLVVTIAASIFPFLTILKPLATILSFAGVACLTVLYSAYMSIISLSLIDGKKVELSTLPEYAPMLARIGLGEFTYFAIVLVGYMFFIVPGIILGTIYYFSIYKLLDNPNISIGQAFKAGAQLSKGHRITIFGYALIALTLETISGSFLTPVIYLGAAHLYRQLQPKSY